MIIFWLIITTLLMPWIIIILRFNVIEKIFDVFEELMITNKNDWNGEAEITKKTGLFYYNMFGIK